MSIELSARDADSIRAEGEETFPHECCGFMLGKADDGARRVEKLLRAENDREDEARHNRFSISPDAFMRGEKEARKLGLDIVGFYHSHPNASARPSQYDLDQAWPWYSYVIVSIEEETAAEMTSWVLMEDRSAFEEEALRIAGQSVTTRSAGSLRKAP